MCGIFEEKFINLLWKLIMRKRIIKTDELITFGLSHQNVWLYKCFQDSYFCFLVYTSGIFLDDLVSLNK
jgi:hypothetical protein